MKVVCLGSGNVATHFVRALRAKGITVSQVWSRNAEHAALLATEADAFVLQRLEEVDKDADLYLIAVKDDAIAGVSSELRNVNGVVVHTSGATSIEVLSGNRKYGVLYPLQTFSRDKAIDFSNIPLCLEANDGKTMEFITSLSERLSNLVYTVDSEQRAVLHLSAAFACNFVNHLYALSNQILHEKGLGFELIRPLIMETAEKVMQRSPETVQTGPAIRGDEQSMAAHLRLLNDKPELTHIYEILSASIKKTIE